MHWAPVNAQKEEQDSEIFTRSHLFNLKDSIFAFRFAFLIGVCLFFHKMRIILIKKKSKFLYLVK